MKIAIDYFHVIIANMNPNLDPDKELNKEEQEVERALRPKAIDDFMGQPKIVDNLFVFIEAAKQRNEALDHVLLRASGAR